MLLAAIGLSSPQAANGGGPKGQALLTGGGEQTIEAAIGQRGHDIACDAAPRGKMFVNLCVSPKPRMLLIDATATWIAPQTVAILLLSFGRCSSPHLTGDRLLR